MVLYFQNNEENDVAIADADWKRDYAEDLDVHQLRGMFLPSERYRVSEFKYSAGTVIGGAMLPGKCFCFLGSVTFEFGEKPFRIDAGKWIQLPGGSYRLRVDESSDSRIILVWEIPSV